MLERAPVKRLFASRERDGNPVKSDLKRSRLGSWQDGCGTPTRDGVSEVAQDDGSIGLCSQGAARPARKTTAWILDAIRHRHATSEGYRQRRQQAHTRGRQHDRKREGEPKPAVPPQRYGRTSARRATRIGGIPQNFFTRVISAPGLSSFRFCSSCV